MTNTYYKKGVNETVYPKVIKSGTAYEKMKVYSGSGLPNVSFLFNYNAKEFDSETNTFPKTTGQIFDEDLVLTNAPYSTSIQDGYVTLNGNSYMNVTFQTYNDNIFNRYNTPEDRTLTIVFKVNWSNTSVSEKSLLGNRGHLQSQSSYYNYHNYMLRPNMLTCSTDVRLTTDKFGVYYVRVNSDASCIFKCVTNNEYTEAQNMSYYHESGNFTFFGDSNYGIGSNLHFSGDFYWFYLSNEALTDQQIQEVIDYNENMTVPVSLMQISAPKSRKNIASEQKMNSTDVLTIQNI